MNRGTKRAVRMETLRNDFVVGVQQREQHDSGVAEIEPRLVNTRR